MIPRRIDTLIVAEKPGVAKAFAEFLSDNKYREIKYGRTKIYIFHYKGEIWASIGLRGHLMDFDFPEEYNSWQKVDPRRLFFIKPIRKTRKGSWSYIKALKLLASRAKKVILAPDADVEGESIGFEVMSIISRVNPNASFERAWFNAVTRHDILQAVNTLRKPNPNLANKAFARMVTDLTIGAAFTRALTLIAEKGGAKLPRGKFISYGPCQTPVLYLVVKRALERENFKSKKYYVIEALLGVEGQQFKAAYAGGTFGKREDAEKVYDKIKDVRKGTVEDSQYDSVEIKPPVPLNTVELERRASSFLNIRSREALAIAEDLYQNGLISYPRTDTNIYPPTINLKQIASQFLNHPELGAFVRREILSGKVQSTSGKEDDKAHPPIYPTRYATKSFVIKSFGDKAWKLYDFIVRHFLATLSPPAVQENQTLKIDIKGAPFVATGSRLLEEGFYEVYPYRKPSDTPLPYLLKGDIVKVLRISVVEKKTKPPPYLSEAELLHLMKKYGIGTDATMQDHIHTNLKRKYFIIKSKRCIPTELGKNLAVILYETVPEILLPEVRGKMEKRLALIAQGEREPDEVVREIKEEFLEYYDRLLENRDKIEEKIVEAINNVYLKYRSKRKINVKRKYRYMRKH